MNLTLAEIVRQETISAEYVGEMHALQKKIAGISTDSRTIKPGDLFFAIKGDNFDGHDFIATAFDGGALVSMVSERWFGASPDKPPGNYLVVKDSLAGFQATAHYYRTRFSPKVIAITGSTGKTTTKEMLYHILAEKYNTLYNIKSFNNHIGVPLTLFRLNESHEVAILEIGANHFHEVENLAQIAEPHYGLITNIGYGHLEFFGSLEGVAKAKLELFRYLEKKGTIFYCSDDEILSNAEIPLAKKVVTFGIEKAAQIEGTILGCDNNARYTLKVQGEKIKLNISGRHNVYNALAAIAVGLEMNVPIEQIKRGLQKFSPVENRMEILNLQGVVVINDTYNSNPSSAKAALQTLADMQAGHNGRKIVVMGGMAELGDYARLEHERMGQLIAMLGFSELCTYGENTEYMNKAVVKSGKIETHHFSDHKSLSDYLLNTIHKGDIVLVKGSRAMAMEKVVDMLSASLNSKRMN